MSRARLLEGRIPGALASHALPNLLGIVFTLGVELVDALFIARVGTRQLAALGFTFPIVAFVMAISFGLGVGSTSAIARSLGAGDDEASCRLSTHAVALAGLCVVAISGVGLLTQDALFAALGADESLVPLLSDYMTIWYAGAISVVVTIVAVGAIRANGDARSPAIILAVAALTNAVLDPLLIFGWGPVPAMGMEGAALATVGSRGISMVMSLRLLRRGRLIALHRPRAGELRASWRSVLAVGGPATASNLVQPAAAALLTALVAKHGAEAVAGYGVAQRIESVALIPVQAFQSALFPFIGLNWGAGHRARVAEAGRLAIRFAVGWGAVVFVVMMVAAGPLASAIADDPAVADSICAYLWIVSLSYGAVGVVRLAAATLNAVERAMRATVLSVCRSAVFALPLVGLGHLLAGLWGIYAGLCLASLLCAGLAWAWLRPLVQPGPSTSSADACDEAGTQASGREPPREAAEQHGERRSD